MKRIMSVKENPDHKVQFNCLLWSCPQQLIDCSPVITIYSCNVLLISVRSVINHYIHNHISLSLSHSMYKYEFFFSFFFSVVRQCSIANCPKCAIPELDYYHKFPPKNQYESNYDLFSLHSTYERY